MEKGSVYGVDFDLFLLKALDGVTALERAYVPALQKLIDKYEADRFGEPLTTVRVRRGQSGAVATSRWNSSPSPPLEASRMIGRYEEDDELSAYSASEVADRKIRSESAGIRLAVQRIQAEDPETIYALIDAMIEDRLAKRENARSDLINSAAFDPDGEA